MTTSRRKPKIVMTRRVAETRMRMKMKVERLMMRVMKIKSKNKSGHHLTHHLTHHSHLGCNLYANRIDC